MLHVPAKSLQSHLTLCDPMDCSLPGSSVHGISQARVLEWVAVRSYMFPDLGEVALHRRGSKGLGNTLLPVCKLSALEAPPL